jgi:hypothetical protein
VPVSPDRRAGRRLTRPRYASRMSLRSWLIAFGAIGSSSWRLRVDGRTGLPCGLSQLLLHDPRSICAAGRARRSWRPGGRCADRHCPCRYRAHLSPDATSNRCPIGAAMTGLEDRWGRPFLGGCAATDQHGVSTGCNGNAVAWTRAPATPVVRGSGNRNFSLSSSA